MMLFIVVSFAGACLMYLLAHINGMPVKRWTFTGGVFGPLAVLFFSVHLRRAWMKNYKQLPYIKWIT